MKNTIRSGKSQVAGECQPPRWTIGQENLLALALGTSLRPRTTMRWLPQGQRARSVGGRKKADPTSLRKHLKTLPRSAPYSNPSSSFHILGLSSEGPRSSEKLIIAFRLSILKSKTHHRRIVDRLKRPPKILQTLQVNQITFILLCNELILGLLAVAGSLGTSFVFSKLDHFHFNL